MVKSMETEQSVIGEIGSQELVLVDMTKDGQFHDHDTVQ